MAQWELLTQRLLQSGDRLRLTWPDMETLVGELPASATKHRAWWSGDRPHVRAWRSAGFSLTELVPGKEVTFARAAPSRRSKAAGDDPLEHAGEPIPSPPGQGGDPTDALLVTCVKAKRATPAAAKDLYVSPLFIKQRQHAERLGVPWFILSAEHALVGPEEWLAPYERRLIHTPDSYRAAWGSWVAERLELLLGPLQDKTVEVHAAAAYLDAVCPALTMKGARVVAPLVHLTFGERLNWYMQQAPAASTGQAASSGTHADSAAFVVMLLNEAAAVSPATFLAEAGDRLKKPGLYSWWVDTQGAQDLADGLGLTVDPGLIYAGLAGATRWPSGRRSTNTLWSRIAGMHLGAEDMSSPPSAGRLVP